MYKEYYQLTEDPFNVTADPGFYFSSDQHADAFSNLLYGIEERKGIMLLTGEIGTGKTTITRTLLSRLDDRTKTALILNPKFSDLQLLQFIVKDFGIEGDYQDKFSLVNALNTFLLHESSLGHNVVIIIDESQNLTVDQLEQIRLLSNLETEKQKLLQIILIGQPELDDKLKLNELRQLNQRITVRYHLHSLPEQELMTYIEHRLAVASTVTDNQYKVHFTDDAVSAIYKHTKGTPRKVNILCDRALLAGYAMETFAINGMIVEQAAEEVFC